MAVHQHELSLALHLSDGMRERARARWREVFFAFPGTIGIGFPREPLPYVWWVYSEFHGHIEEHFIVCDRPLAAACKGPEPDAVDYHSRIYGWSTVLENILLDEEMLQLVRAEFAEESATPRVLHFRSGAHLQRAQPQATLLEQRISARCGRDFVQQAIPNLGQDIWEAISMADVSAEQNGKWTLYHKGLLEVYVFSSMSIAEA